jgi:hypothetical protein
MSQRANCRRAPLWPTSLLKGGLALLFRAVELHELEKGHPWLKLDAAGAGILVPL